MAILKVARLGTPILRRIAASVLHAEITSSEMQRFIDDLIETCHEYDGAGLAAPQVYVGKRIAMIEVLDNPRYPDAKPVALTVVINPEITPLTTDTITNLEGCLSVPDIRGEVTRIRRVMLRGFDRQGQPFSQILEDFGAAVAQHECDHLDGRVFVDRVADTTTLGFLPEIQRARRNATRE